MILPNENPAALAAEAAQLLRRLPHMVIATATTEAQPWAVPVHQKTQPDGRMTWRSRLDARHSGDIATNPKTSAVLYELADHGEVSIYLEGTSELVEKLDAEYGIYAFMPSAVWMNDDNHGKYPVDLAKLREALAA